MSGTVSHMAFSHFLSHSPVAIISCSLHRSCWQQGLFLQQWVGTVDGTEIRVLLDQRGEERQRERPSFTWPLTCTFTTPSEEQSPLRIHSLPPSSKALTIKTPCPPPPPLCPNTTTTPPLAHTHSGTMWEQVWLHIKNEKGKTGSLFSFSAPHPAPSCHLPTLPPTSHPSHLTETVAHCHDTLSSETHHKKRGNNSSQPGRCHWNVNTDPAHTSSTYILQVGVGATNSWLSHIYSVRDSNLPDTEFQLLLSGACFNCSPFNTVALLSTHTREGNILFYNLYIVDHKVDDSWFIVSPE